MNGFYGAGLVVTLSDGTVLKNEGCNAKRRIFDKLFGTWLDLWNSLGDVSSQAYIHVCEFVLGHGMRSSVRFNSFYIIRPAETNRRGRVAYGQPA